MIAADRFVDDRDRFRSDAFSDLELPVVGQDRRAKSVGFAGVAEGLVRESLGQRVVDDKRKTPRRVGRGVGEHGRELRGLFRAAQEQV